MNLVIITIFYFILVAQYGLSKEYSFNSKWDEDTRFGYEFETCYGKHRNPIDKTLYDVVPGTFPPLNIDRLNFRFESCFLWNNGNKIQMTFQYAYDNIPLITDGPFKQDFFRLEHLYFHWGHSANNSSKNRFHNSTFPSELHLMFFNLNYEDFQEASRHDFGLAAMAFSFKIEKNDNPYYEELVSHLSIVRRPFTSIFLNETGRIRNLLPKKMNTYFTYIGTNFAFPCSAKVYWIDITTPIPISEKQLQSFHELKNHDGELYKENFEPSLENKDRKIYLQQITIPSGIPYVKSYAMAIKISMAGLTLGILGIIATHH